MVKKGVRPLIEYTRNKNKIKNFIEKTLKTKLEEDQVHLKIITEGDLQSLVYHHLRNFFDEKNIKKYED